MPGLGDLIDTTFGPFPVEVTRDRAEAFVASIGGDPGHDSEFAHPMFANAALFAAAPAFLEDERVAPYTTSLIHSEQTYLWHSALPVGSTVQVLGTVQSVRARGALNLVTFGLEATGPGGVWLTGSSVFLLSEEAAASAEDAGEPDENDRPPTDVVMPADLPEAGEEIRPVRCGASRADLARYAAASGDWNPIHLEHESARRAGLEGVIVHGLLMAAWLARVAGGYGSLREMRIRFRNPLRPAVPAVVTGTVHSVEAASAELDMALATGDTRLVTARVSVTR